MSNELRDAQGERFDFSQALLHIIGYWLCTAFFIVQILSIIMMLGIARGAKLDGYGARFCDD